MGTGSESDNHRLGPVGRQGGLWEWAHERRLLGVKASTFLSPHGMSSVAMAYFIKYHQIPSSYWKFTAIVTSSIYTEPLQCSLFWVIWNTGFLNRAIKLYRHDSLSHDTYISFQCTDPSMMDLCIFQPVFAYLELIHIYCQPHLNERLWFTMCGSESCSKVMWISLNSVLSSYQYKPRLLRALFCFPF